MISMGNELETLLHELKQKVETVLEEVEAEFILYGSRAKGDFDHDSDIDEELSRAETALGAADLLARRIDGYLTEKGYR